MLSNYLFIMGPYLRTIGIYCKLISRRQTNSGTVLSDLPMNKNRKWCCCLQQDGTDQIIERQSALSWAVSIYCVKTYCCSRAMRTIKLMGSFYAFKNYACLGCSRSQRHTASWRWIYWNCNPFTNIYVFVWNTVQVPSYYEVSCFAKRTQKILQLGINANQA